MSNNATTTGAGQSPERKRNRRGFLAAGVATGLAALGLGRLASGDPAMAADGDNLILGVDNFVSHPTQLIMDGTVNNSALIVTNQGSSAISAGLAAYSSGTGISAPAIYGQNAHIGGFGVIGDAGSGGDTGVLGKGPVGVHGNAQNAVGGTGVFGETSDTTSETYGVQGRTQGSQGRAVFGWSQATAGGTGVWGQSNNGTGVGVRGYAWDNGTGQFGTGVMGTSGSHTFPPPPPIANTGVFAWFVVN